MAAKDGDCFRLEAAKFQFRKIVEQEWQRFFAHFKAESEFIGQHVYRLDQDKIVRNTVGLCHRFMKVLAEQKAGALLAKTTNDFRDKMFLQRKQFTQQ